jgi:hypothetical protein
VPADTSREFSARLLESLRELPDVEAAALATSVPLDIHGSQSTSFTVEGHARSDGASDRADMNIVTPGYFDLMQIDLVTGHDFADLRDPAAPAEAIVNEAFVRRYATGLDPIGRRLTVRNRPFTIVAVARDSTYNAFGEPPTPFIYFSQRDRSSASMEIHVRGRGEPEAVTGLIRTAIHRLDPALPLYNVRSLDRHVESNLVFQRIPARMFLALGPLLLALAALGIYAVASHGVAQRTAELGTRIALGATTNRVTRMLVGETMQTVLLGAAGGLAIALLVDSSPLAGDLASLSLMTGVTAVFLVVALAACLVPARRASRTDPATALKSGL